MERSSPNVLMTIAIPLTFSPLPGPVVRLVTPPFTASFQSGSSRSSASRMRCCGPMIIGRSFRSVGRAPMWECSSMKPGTMIFPVASMTVAPAGTATLRPTAAMRPSRTTMVASGIGAPVAVWTVAPRTTSTCCAGRSALANARSGAVTAVRRCIVILGGGVGVNLRLPHARASGTGSRARGRRCVRSGEAGLDAHAGAQSPFRRRTSTICAT